jgi:hypothetical protein
MNEERIVLVLPRTGQQKEVRRVGIRMGNLTLAEIKLLWEAEQNINRLTGIRVHIMMEPVAEESGSHD